MVYDVIVGKEVGTVATFKERVNAHLKLGWKPQGGVNTKETAKGTIIFIQAIVWPSSRKKPEYPKAEKED